MAVHERSGWSAWTTCPQSSITSTRLPAIRAAQLLRVPHRDERVLATPDDERWHLDTVQPPTEAVVGGGQANFVVQPTFQVACAIAYSRRSRIAWNACAACAASLSG